MEIPEGTEGMKLTACGRDRGNGAVRVWRAASQLM